MILLVIFFFVVLLLLVIVSLYHWQLMVGHHPSTTYAGFTFACTAALKRNFAITMLFISQTRLHPLHPRTQRADLAPSVFSPTLGLVRPAYIAPSGEGDDNTTAIILRA